MGGALAATILVNNDKGSFKREKNSTIKEFAQLCETFQRKSRTNCSKSHTFCNLVFYFLGFA